MNPVQPDVSVVLPTHNPHPERLRRTLAGLRAQTLPVERWETLLIDNASQPAVDLAAFASGGQANLRLICEPRLGLTSARLCGFKSATGRLIVLVDDDNVLAPDYLAHVIAIFERDAKLGAIGGKSVGEFESEPQGWQRDFLDLLAIRSLGEKPTVVSSLRSANAPRNEYPLCAPIGAGMALRRETAAAWCDALAQDPQRREFDRTGRQLTSGGDNDIVMTVLRAGWSVGYFPQLQLAHLIPRERLDPGYLARLNRAIQSSWMRVLALHDANPWPPIPAWTVPLRQMKAWFTFQAWRSTAHYIRWQGACGHFEGRRR